MDLRLVAGVVLVLGSVLIGVKVVSAADHTARYWAAARNLSPGLVLEPGDLRSADVRLPGAAQAYFPISANPFGQTVQRPVAAGELLPRSALGSTAPAITIIIPIGGDAAPKISIGQQITIWVSTTACPAAMVLADVTVQGVGPSHTSLGSGGGGEDVIVAVTPDQAQRVISALALNGAVLRAGVVTGQPTPAPVLPDLSMCAVTS